MARPPARKPRIAALLLLLTLAAAAQDSEPEQLASGAEILAGQPPSVVARLQEEKMVMLQEIGVGGEAHGGMIHALVLLERPRNEVIRFLIQSPRQIEFRPELRRARLVEESDAGHVVDYEMRMMLIRVNYRAIHGWDFEKGQVWWSLDPEADNDLATLEGRWEVFALGPEQSLARFGTRIDVGPGLPTFLQDFATRTKLPDAMHNVRKWIDSGGTFRP